MNAFALPVDFFDNSREIDVDIDVVHDAVTVEGPAIREMSFERDSRRSKTASRRRVQLLAVS